MTEEEQEVLERAGYDYKQVFDEWEAHNKTSAKAYIGAACIALVQKNPYMSNKEVRQTVKGEAIKRRLCAENTAQQYLPDWSRREYNKKDDNFIQHIKLFEDDRTEAYQSTIENYKAADEQLTETLEQEPEKSYTEGGTIGKADKEPLTPWDIYDKSINAFGRAFKLLTDTKHIPGPSEDFLIDYVKPSEKYRLRMLKGIDDDSAAHFINMTIYVNRLTKHILEEWNELKKGRSTYSK